MKGIRVVNKILGVILSYLVFTVIIYVLNLLLSFIVGASYVEFIAPEGGINIFDKFITFITNLPVVSDLLMGILA